MWLTDRFRCVRPRLPWDSREFFSRYDYALASPLSSFDWTVRFSELASSIRWEVPWWRLRSMIVSMGGQNFIWIRGLRETSFYIPGQLTRQFSVSLSIPLPLRDFSSDTPLITYRLDQTLHGLWATSYIRRFQFGDCGIWDPMRSDLIWRIWALCPGQDHV